MSEETKAVEATNEATPQETQQTQQTQETQSQETKTMTFTQQQLDNIIKTRLEAEKKKHEKDLQAIKDKEAEILKEELIAKQKADHIKKEIEKAKKAVMDLQEALNKLKPSVMLNLVVDGKYGTKTQGMLKAVGQKMPSLGIGNKTSVSKELFDKIVLASKTSGYFTVWR